MTARPARRRHAWLLAPALLAMIGPSFGCLGASDDKLGSGNASKEGSGIDEGAPIKSTTQQNRNDKGDNPMPGMVENPQNDAAKTGGLGENRPGPPVGPGDTGPHSSSAPGVGPK